MSLYSEAARDAIESLEELGQTISIDRINSGGAETVPDTIGAEFDYKSGQIDGANIISGDKRIIIQSLVEPKISDTITTASGTAKVMNIKTLGPSGEVVIYELQVRY